MTTKDGNVAKLAVDEITVPGTDVSVYQALYQRRMAWKFKDEAVPKVALERMLEAAVWAPNHRLTEALALLCSKCGKPAPTDTWRPSL